MSAASASASGKGLVRARFSPTMSARAAFRTATAFAAEPSAGALVITISIACRTASGSPILLSSAWSTQPARRYTSRSTP